MSGDGVLVLGGLLTAVAEIGLGREAINSWNKFLPLPSALGKLWLPNADSSDGITVGSCLGETLAVLERRMAEI